MERTPGWRTVCIFGICGPAPLTAGVAVLRDEGQVSASLLQHSSRFGTGRVLEATGSQPACAVWRRLSAVIDFRNGVEYSVALNTSEAQGVLKAVGAGKVVARNSRDAALSWSTSSLIRFGNGTNILGEIPFHSDEFWMAEAVYGDETGEFRSMQSRLSVAKPATNAPSR